MCILRARIGVLVPPLNTVLEPEMYALAPKGITVHFVRQISSQQLSAGFSEKAFSWKRGEKEALDDFIECLEESVRKLTLVKVDGVALGCTSGSFYKGSGWAKELAQRIERISGVPATTASQAAIEALEEMEVKKVAVATPYETYLNSRLEKFLEMNEISVVNMKELGLRLADSDKISGASPQVVYDLAKIANNSTAEGVFIACTNFPTLQVIEPLELDLGKPVVTANQAMFWAILRKIGIREPIEGYGMLLRKT